MLKLRDVLSDHQLKYINNARPQEGENCDSEEGAGERRRRPMIKIFVFAGPFLFIGFLVRLPIGRLIADASFYRFQEWIPHSH